jgi:hypothetical protein
MIEKIKTSPQRSQRAQRKSAEEPTDQTILLCAFLCAPCDLCGEVVDFSV